MTIQDASQRVDDVGPEHADAGSVVASTRSAHRAYDRRRRRQQRMSGQRLTRTGSPIHAALSRVPFVLLAIALLAGAIVGVLWLNTMTDEAGLRAVTSRQQQAAVKQQIEAAQRDVAGLGALSRIESAARAMGLVRAGDAALIKLDQNGSATVIGTPTPAAAPAVPAPASTPAAITTPTPAQSTTPIATAPKVTAGTPAAPKATAPKVAAPKVAVPKVSAPNVAAPKVTAPNVAAPKDTAPKVAAPKATAPKTTAPKTAEKRTSGTAQTPKNTAGGTGP